MIKNLRCFTIISLAVWLFSCGTKKGDSTVRTEDTAPETVKIDPSI